MSDEYYDVHPEDAEVLLSPYTQRLMQSGKDSRIILSRATNYLLKSFSRGHNDTNMPEGTNNVPDYEDRISCILDGLETTFEISGSLLVVTVSPGTLIVDDTLLIFPNETAVSLDLDANSAGQFGTYSYCGPIILSVNYQWVGTIDEDAPTLRLNYHNSSGTLVPNGWEMATDKLIVTKFTWNRTEGGDIDVDSFVNLNPKPMAKTDHTLLHTVSYVPYEIGPLPKFYSSLFQTLDQLHTRKLTTTISLDQWDNDIVPPFEVSQSHIYVDIDISRMDTDIPIVQCYVDSLMISPSSIQLYDDSTVRVWMPSSFTDEDVTDMTVVIIG